MKKIKLIDLLLKQEKFKSREKAESTIMSGLVIVNGKTVDKPGTIINDDSSISLKKKSSYVSRGGIKIEKACIDLNIKFHGKKVIDIGSSTGGFTDYSLKNGAINVIAVDVGYGILSWELRNSNKVTVLERTNARYLRKNELPFIPDIMVMDVSFISIQKIFNSIIELVKEDGEMLILLKPQFELKRHEIEKGGVIKNPELHKISIKRVVEFLKSYPVEIKDITFSKIRGAKGNIEYWIYLKKAENNKKSGLNYDKIISNIVLRSHLFFSPQDNTNE